MDIYFEKICPYCKENGKVINPKFLEWSLNDCVGEKPEEIVNCPICEGSCIVLNDLGMEVLNLSFETHMV